MEAGPDSCAGRLVSVMAGSIETAFYVLAVHMGAVGVRRYPHPLPAGLIADAVGFAASVLVVRAVLWVEGTGRSTGAPSSERGKTFFTSASRSRRADG